MLEGKTIIVTGAAQGMGRRHLETCVDQGAHVVATDLQVELGRQVVEPLGKDAVFVPHDVTVPSDWDRVVATARERFGAVHGLVNNAAVYYGPAPIDQETFETFERTLRVNLFGTWWGIKTVIDPMRQSGGGSIVNISSTAGLTGMAGFTSYGSSKWAVRGLTKSAANDLGPDGIRVNSVHPGGIAETGMYPTPATDSERAARLGRIALRRAGTVDEVSALVAFLLSDASSYITGVEHVIDGGSILGGP
jgi:3alpha(or 20beta)-hydroxysteroid dehydrogenase